MEVAAGVRRLGSRWVNFYLVEEGGRLTLLDAGYPGYWSQLEVELREMGRRMDDIDAILLTHSHADHRGLAERTRRASRAPVYIHPADAPSAQGDVPERLPAFLKQGWRPFLYRYIAHAIVNGAGRQPPVAALDKFADGDVVDVPGHPRVIHTPGHTPGSCALHLADRGVLFCGDTLATIDLLAGKPRPALPPDFVNHNTGQAIESARILEGFEARLMLPGHGEPWTGGFHEAVRIATEGMRLLRAQVAAS